MRLTFGRYIDYNSIMHRLDPRVKLVMLISLMAAIFVRTGFTGYVLLASVVLSLFFISKLRPRMLLSLLKPVLFIFIVLFIINCFLIRQGYVGWHWGGQGSVQGNSLGGGSKSFIVSEKAFFIALYMAFRIYLMIMITTILTATTQPLDLTLALEDVLSPLKLVFFPVHILSMIISITLRMIPTLIEEAGRIMKAQASRGVDFKHGHLKDKVKSTISLIIPLLVSAFQKAEDLAYAMDARGYDPHGKRTRYRKYRIKIVDVLFFIVVVGTSCIIFAQANTMGKYESFYYQWVWNGSEYVWARYRTGFIPINIPHVEQFL